MQDCYGRASDGYRNWFREEGGGTLPVAPAFEMRWAVAGPGSGVLTAMLIPMAGFWCLEPGLESPPSFAFDGSLLHALWMGERWLDRLEAQRRFFYVRAGN